MRVPIVGDFHYNGHLLLRKYPECARALAKYRINPGNVNIGKKHDDNFRTMIETAIEFDRPVRIGVNWGSLDGALLTRMMDENNRLSEPLDARAVTLNAIVVSALESAAAAERYGLGAGQDYSQRQSQRSSGSDYCLSRPCGEVRLCSTSRLNRSRAWERKESWHPPPVYQSCCRKGSATPSEFRSLPRRTGIAPKK